ncbi:GntR family transcriptional regulator [Collinsella phocaeensis]|uniref:GntR family transcriptional regulator n=1 Tax=Collinsella phocaeensis TaxID=1871016 RepID=UPI000A82A139|nr:GntR family transcriptional regulator [Collinsella phocaeensis]
MEGSPITKASEAPLYYQLYSVLKERIIDGVYAVGSILPSESDMIQEFGVSRITIRRALADLENDGYIEKRKGKGSLVLRMRLERPLTVFNSFSGDTLSRGDRPSSIILALSASSPACTSPRSSTSSRATRSSPSFACASSTAASLPCTNHISVPTWALK